MSDGHMDAKAAQFVVRSLIRRFAPNPDGNFQLQGPITPEEIEALRFLVATPGGATDVGAATVSSTPPRRRFGEPAVVPSVQLDKGCLTVDADESGDIVAVDFGTAFSKSALWPARSGVPTPLDLAAQISESSGNMLESSVYITESVIYFGPKAEAIFREEDNQSRSIFDSPKQELSILSGGALLQNASPDLDPTSTLTKRDLLTLYLAYLSSAISSALEAAGASRHTVRRFAVPVWKAEKLKAVSGLLKRLLVDAQMVADTLPQSVWREGLAVSDAKRILNEIASSVTDEERDRAAFISRHVVEAAAAAAAIGEKLADRRPVALILDVGAGTTDIGLYRFALPKSDTWKIAPFEACQGALTLAGKALDERLIDFVRSEAAIDVSSADGQRVMWALRRDIRQHKALMFGAGFVDIEELGGRRFNRDQFLASAAVQQFQTDLRRQVTELLSKVGRENMIQPDGQFGVVTGGGANVSIFRDMFDDPFDLEDGSVKFEFADTSPQWLNDYTPDIRSIFPQLAVSIGASSPYLPDSVRPITDVSVAAPRVAEVTYRAS